MASGNAVMERPEIWGELSGMGVRDITGLEMEAATIATVAETEQVPLFLIAKGVMDHAINKEDCGSSDGLTTPWPAAGRCSTCSSTKQRMRSP